ncbi:MAG: hypothetical protein CO094_12060 [Anaerolineae bacterium CG_4_9_14_3_um_filter_57_17]|nr:hypothetical protein [bacterium]NCT20300.1 hypothetical protein [bacterium]OIO84778.1 MAG: hypothetical protein AUK01_08160 [Anaerolineae bacterium CG2_30_57_67]PJB64711.1 MAG: hypothetical protein CO094_12060 [Anaerolineae bacterium CG_4_9_14_3_um_filter_57_17]
MKFFFPPKQRGYLVHLALMAALGLLAVFAAWNVYGVPLDLRFSLFIALFLATFLPLPALAYRVYALSRASYGLDRNTLRLTWGLRSEEIPVGDVEWLRPADDLTTPLALPWLRLPGGILGVTRHPDLREVEFLASRADSLLLVATARQVYAISPADPAAFAAAFQKTVEMGSLRNAESRSEYPSFVVGLAWENRLARGLWVAGLLINLGLLVWASILLPGLQRLPLGFDTLGRPIDLAPAGQLILIPLLSALLALAGWLAGLFFYRREELRPLALAVWLSSALSSLSFLLAVFFIVTTPL